MCVMLLHTSHGVIMKKLTSGNCSIIINIFNAKMIDDSYLIGASICSSIFSVECMQNCAYKEARAGEKDSKNIIKTHNLRKGFLLKSILSLTD